jgi:hypothetical protein
VQAGTDNAFFNIQCRLIECVEPHDCVGEGNQLWCDYATSGVATDSDAEEIIALVRSVEPLMDRSPDDL